MALTGTVVQQEPPLLMVQSCMETWADTLIPVAFPSIYKNVNDYSYPPVMSRSSCNTSINTFYSIYAP